MMSGMEDMAEGLGDAIGAALGAETEGTPEEEPKEKTLVDLFRSQAQSKASSYGPGVTHVSTVTRKNDLEWEGHESRYRFDDVSQLRIAVGNPDLPDDSPNEGSDSSPYYTFRFTPGETATLEIVPVMPKERKKPEAPVTTVDDDDDAGTAVLEMPAEAVNDMGEAMMAQMMGSMFKGMRMVFAVSVQGEVLDTNAAYPSDKRPGLITVIDLPMDRLIGNTKAMEAVSGEDPRALAKLQQLDIDGLKLEEEGKTIRIRFR
jgi:hypothetical protein